MPHATASWLVDNTSLTFQQIAEFCGLHILEVQAIADDTAATKLTGRDPLRSGELTRTRSSAARTTPITSCRCTGARPGGAHQGAALHAGLQAPGQAGRRRLADPQPSRLSDGQIGKLIGTTRSTIQAIRERSHWNIANIQPKDPVTLGLTSQRELDAAVAKAAKAAGAAAPRDLTFNEDREALIEELRAEREQQVRRRTARKRRSSRLEAGDEAPKRRDRPGHSWRSVQGHRRRFEPERGLTS